VEKPAKEGALSKEPLSPADNEKLVEVDDLDTKITYAGTWNAHDNGWHESETADSSASLTFKGTGISLIAGTRGWGGSCNVYIDGVLQGTASFKGEDGEEQAIFTKTGLANKEHTVKITVIEGWNYLDRFEYTAVN